MGTKRYYARLLCWWLPVPRTRSYATVHWQFPAAGGPGLYHVYVRWSSGSNRASAAVYKVTDTAGTTPIQINQRIGGGRWPALGLFSFHPGAQHGVTLSGEPDGVVVAAAVAWVGPVGVDPSIGL